MSKPDYLYLRHLNKYIQGIAAFILALYSFPTCLRLEPGYYLEGSWMRAINMAVNNKLVFGRDFIFTYGPLGFLSTRYDRYVMGYSLFAGDLVLFACYFYFYKKCLPKSIYWFIIALMAMMLMRYTNYSQHLFLVFMMYAVINIRNKGNNAVELSLCAVTGLLLFFVKVNYGIVSLPVLAGVAAVTIFNNNKRGLAFTGISMALWVAACMALHVHPVDYIRFSMPIISHYDEAMQHTPELISTVRTLGIAAMCLSVEAIMLYYVSRNGQSYKSKIMPAALLALTIYLLYKNAYTREDSVHYDHYFTTIPLFLVLASLATDIQKTIVAKVLCIAGMIVSVYTFSRPKSDLDLIHDTTYLDARSYFFSFAKKQKPDNTDWAKLPAPTKQLIGKQTIDIIPDQVFVLQYNDLNYYPRPIPQSYSTYSTELDSVNAHHFAQSKRPQYLLMKNGTVDNRYFFWDESLTKASIRLHYNYTDTSILEYYLLQSKNEDESKPVFAPLYSRKYRLGDTVKMNFDGEQAIYMNTNIGYTTYGKLYRLFSQVPELSVTLLMSDGTTRTYKAVPPQLRNPVLINKHISDNTDLKHFLKGELGQTKSVTAFVLHPTSNGIYLPECEISFCRFTNY